LPPPSFRITRQQAESATQRALLEGVAETFGLDAPPKRIEVYDNSHISGTNAVGAMIVAGANGLMKQHYRTFNMKSEDLKPGDDFDTYANGGWKAKTEIPADQASAPWSDMCLACPTRAPRAMACSLSDSPILTAASTPTTC